MPRSMSEPLSSGVSCGSWPRSSKRARALRTTSATFPDAEVLTLGRMQSCLKVATLKLVYRIIAHNFVDAFPYLPCYGQWLSRLHALRCASLSADSPSRRCCRFPTPCM